MQAKAIHQLGGLVCAIYSTTTFLKSMKLHRIIRPTLCVCAALSLSACGFIQKEIASEESLLDKAEYATGIPASKLKLVDGSVSASLDGVEYKVKSGKTVYRCGYSTVIAVSSMALCTQLDGSGKPKKGAKTKGHCNDLLRAAGRC